MLKESILQCKFIILGKSNLYTSNDIVGHKSVSNIDSKSQNQFISSSMSSYVTKKEHTDHLMFHKVYFKVFNTIMLNLIMFILFLGKFRRKTSFKASNEN